VLGGRWMAALHRERRQRKLINEFLTFRKSARRLDPSSVGGGHDIRDWKDQISGASLVVRAH
jgi:hypothetical protein